MVPATRRRSWKDNPQPVTQQRTALLSVSDKTGLEACARSLVALGFRILSTGGTEKALRAAGIAVTPVEEVTKFPECFSGRVKTLHPMIAGGILYERDNPEHQKEAKKHGIQPIDLVIVNLYPFAETVAKYKGDNPEIIEQIDIGGPTLLRAAAKNHAHVTVVCDPADYDSVISELQRGDTSPRTRKALAAKVFLHTAAYDALITEHLSEGKNTGVILTDGKTLRYGENPHQWGKYYKVAGDGTRNSELATRNSSWQQLQGKELSYLNILDADGAWTMVRDFSEPTAVFVKHANPSGVASHKDLAEAFQRAYDADKLSAFGVIIALNRPCTEVIVSKIIDQKMFVEVIIAPEYEKKALELFKEKPKIRVLVFQPATRNPQPATQFRSSLDGMLVQEPDTYIVTEKDLTCVTEKKPTSGQIEDLLFAWKVVKNAKSNAIVFVKDRTTIGIGSGQTSRVDATWIAAKRAAAKAKGAVMASDAFFPFPDSVEEAAKAGIAVVIQPGGSVRDAEVFKRADELGLVMVTTGIRGFRH